MRVTQSMILRNTLNRVNLNRDGMNETQNRIASQKKVQKASDDPRAFSRIARFHTNLNQNMQFLKNITDASAWTGTTSAGLDQLHEYAQQAVEYAMQSLDGSSDNPEIQQSLIDSLRGVLQEAVTQANAQYLGKSVYSGTMTSESEPFLLTGDTVTYQGNDEAIRRRFAQDVSMQINTTGQEIMDTGLFDSLSAVIGAMVAGDEDETRAQLANLQDSEKELLALNTSVASLRNSLDLMKDRLEGQNIDLQRYISNDEDASIEEEIVKFQSQQLAYQAALQSASDVMHMNILNYLS